MMQHANRLDDVEGSPKRRQVGDVGLSVFDIADLQRMRLSLSVGEAGQAEIDGQHPRVAEAARRFD
jgi:hypothetical protein